MTILIGSQALHKRFPDSREPKLDYDMMGTVQEFTELAKELSKIHGEITAVKHSEDGDKVYAFFKDNMVLECEIAWPGTLTEKLVDWVNQSEEWLDFSIGDVWVRVPPLNFLYMLKMSHRYKKNSPHFLKTMRDIQFMRSKGAKIGIDTYLLRPLYKQRMKETYNYAHPNLKQTKKDFFTDDVPYKYDHDSIHRAIAAPNDPAYTYVKDCQDEVFMKKENFYASSLVTQLMCVLEESMVLALERSIIPFDSFENPERIDWAFKMALFKVCTSITSGWFREFAWENYDTVLEMYGLDSQEFVNRFKKGLDSGIVLPYTKPAY